MKPLFRTSMLTFVFFCFLSVSNYACTIFVLTDSHKTLFFNNEDYSNPATRIWFLPEGKDYYGSAYVGYDDNWAQGGVNTKGLAFDWVAGFKEDYKPAGNMIEVKGNPSERMLESCATVEEAIAFFRKYAEPGFSYAKILVADKTGASVIIGAKNGKIQFDKSNSSRGFGYGMNSLNKMLSPGTKPTLGNGLPILESCLQQGNFATKYSNVFDLITGEIILISSFKENENIKVNLIDELAKGGHYYDLPQIETQLKLPLLPLLPTMHRFLSDVYKPIPDSDPAITKKIREILEGATKGIFSSDDFSPEFWKQFSPNIKDAQQQLNSLGKLQSLTLVENINSNAERNFLYALEFENASILQRYVFNKENKLVMIKSEGGEIKVGIRNN